MAENKNQYVLGYISWLVGNAGMRVVSFISARVGHTHNRLDAVYGLLSHAFRFIDRLVDLDDVKRLLTQHSSNHGIQSPRGVGR